LRLTRCEDTVLGRLLVIWLYESERQREKKRYKKRCKKRQRKKERKMERRRGSGICF
jgi:hypothetical protein